MGNRLGRSVSARKPLYIEIRIEASLDRVWELSQDPQAHPRWDLRFSRIIPIEEDEQRQVRFCYEYLLPLGHRQRADGQATSVLKFDTTDPLSPIGPGAGYWRYIPTEDGLRFITGYNYEPGMGLVGKTFDSSIIRPALGWATALSFDRLRLWAESDLEPQTSRNRWMLDAGARTGGVLVAVGLLRRALSNGSPAMAVLSAAAVVIACVAEPHWSVPRAGRCLRKAPDERSARAPSTLTGLREPDQVGIANKQPQEMK